MIFSILNSFLSGENFDITSIIISLLVCIPIAMLALSVHETAHGYVAYKLGDPTARSMGRLSLNPLKHFDLFGFISFVLLGYGWAKPVPINPRYFKDPKKGMALTAAAGPLSNLVLAIIFATLYGSSLKFLLRVSFPNEATLILAEAFLSLLYAGVSLNVSLMIFNLIPVPPFDGSRIFLSFLPPKYYWKIMQYERYIYMAFLILLVIGVFDKPINIARNFVLDLILDLFIRI